MLPAVSTPLAGTYEVVDGVALMTHPEQVLAFGSVGKAAELVATMIRYDVAPLTADHVKVGVVDCTVAPFDGAYNVGAARY